MIFLILNGNFDVITDKLIKNCFNPEKSAANSGWESSSSRMLYLWCKEKIELLINKLTTGESKFIDGDISPDQIMNEFDRLLSISVCINIYQPIVWRTTRSRKNSVFGQFMTVNIKKGQLPPRVLPLSNTSRNTTSLSLRSGVTPKKVTDTFFTKLSQNFGKGNIAFKMNLRSFLIHVIIYKTFGNLSDDNYVIEKMNEGLEGIVFQSLGLQSWFKNDKSVANAYKNTKKQKNALKLNQQQVLMSYCENYTINSDDDGGFEYVNEDILSISKICFQRTNSAIIRFIASKYYEYLNPM